jgi:hypothetical protein
MKWVSVKDRLPDDIIYHCIVCLENNSVMEMQYSKLSERWWKIGIGDECKTNKVTHWMPLPEPPNTLRS